MEDVIKSRKIRLAKAVLSDQKSGIQTKLLEMEGLLSANFKDDKTLAISYNLFHLNLEKAEQFIKESGLEISTNALRSFIKGWVVFAEENELTNLRTTPKSCCEVSKR